MIKDFIEDRIKVFLEEFEKLTVKKRDFQTGFLYKECDYKKGNSLPPIDESFREFVPYRDRWGGKKDTHAWFYKELTVPADYGEGEVTLEIASDARQGWACINPQFIAYVNGVLQQGIDKNHREVFLESGKTYQLYLYGYSGSIHGEYLDFTAELRLYDELTRQVYYDIKVPFEILEFEDENSRNYFEIKKYLNNAVNMIDLRSPYSEEYYNSLRRAADYLKTEFYGKYCREGEIHAICIGHTHIDVAWEWTLAQTREKALRSFSTVLALMEKYPEYKFMSSQPQLYKYLKEESPELYEKVKEKIKEGRWEVEGGMWVEADCNLSSGESLVRQFLYGKRFIKEEFGIDSRVLWLPDVFGYSAALPQIMKKCGIDKFITSKIGWNESNKMPYDTFMWHGIDSTPIFTYFMTAQGKRKGQEPATNVTYNAKLNPSQLRGAYDRYQQKGLYDDVLITFGFGDGGGGPYAKDLEYYERLKHGIPGTSTAKMGFAGDFLEDVKAKTENNPKIPHWVGELYLEFHRGTYTSQARNKKYNRRSEFMLQRAEALSLMANELASTAYPQDTLTDCWETVLLNQFHDIIPGSSIGEVYEVSHKQYEKIAKDGGGVIDNALKAVASRVNTDKDYLVFNPHSYTYSGEVYADGQWHYAENIPAKGYKAVSFAPAEQKITLTDNSMENDYYKITLNSTGAITSIYDKENCREVLSGRGNVLTAYEDYPREYDNWEISSYYTEKSWEVDTLTAVKAVYEGERAGLELTKTFKNSTIIQKIYLHNHSRRIDFDTFVDWKEKHIILRTAFPVDVNADKATFDIQYGSVERPTHKNTSWDAARFEVCAHKYCDLSEYGYGVSLLNDCKYGHAVHNGVMSLTLIKSGTFPDPNADRCEHSFTYALYPHKGGWREAGTIKEAYSLNVPMLCVPAQRGTELAEEYSYLSCGSENIVFETVKQSENGDGIIARGCEYFNSRTKAVIKTGFKFKKAYLCDMLENNISELTADGSSVTVDFKPFEIVTIKFVK